MIDSEYSLTRIQKVSRNLMLIGLMALGSSHALASDALIQVLQERSCSGCWLADADLVHADLRNADLSDAKLMRANLGQAQLDGADLSGADLSFTSLRGASLKGTNLIGSNLYGTDLRNANLAGAQLSPDALDEAHWQGASGVADGIHSHAALHNAGVKSFQAGNWSVAEELFTGAIRKRPTEPLSWVARGISRSEQAKDELAAADFRYAASIYKRNGNFTFEKELVKAAIAVQKRRLNTSKKPAGNGIGSQILGGMSSAIQALAPLAVKALIPMGIGF